MSLSYRWYLSRSMTREQVIEFVSTIPNDGLTEDIDGEMVDIWKTDEGVVQVDPTDGTGKGPVVASIRRQASEGIISADVALYLELAKCILAEDVGATTQTFAGYRCFDLATVLGRVQAALDEGALDDGADGTMLGELEGCLKRALACHVAVVFE